MANFYNLLLKQCINKGVSPSKAANEIGLSNAAASGWKKGKVPYHTTLVKLADYFGCTVADLTGEPPETKKEPAVTGELTPPSEEFIRLQQANELFLQLDEAGRAQALAYLKFLASQQEN